MSIKQILNIRVSPARRNFLLATSVFVLTTAATIIAANANFTGEWNLNEGKSDLGQFGARFAAKKLKIDGQNDAMNVERFTTNQNGDQVTTKEKLTYDGKESESTVFGNAKRKSVAKWSDDGQTLT